MKNNRPWLIKEVGALPDSTLKIVKFVEWLVQFYPNPDRVPILVGGAAVSLYTDGMYNTIDIDFVGYLNTDAENAMLKAGFTKEGKDWVNDNYDLSVEFPSGRLGPTEKSIIKEFKGVPIKIISIEDLIIDRLNAYKYWNQTLEWHNVILLIDIINTDTMVPDIGRLWKRADEEKVSDILKKALI
jgi:hypothetical protein